MQKNTKEKSIGLRLTKLEHLNLQMQSEKQRISISKLVRKKLFNENN
jgi:predicted HicB family RNase H-like nuclease|tara:strand:+ start:844 stop:984 length:141 start_codon:yes stop_codon:yes gene_type:complete